MEKKIVICVMFLVFWTTLILSNNISWFDEPVYNFIISFKDYFLTDVMNIISFFASVTFLIVVCVISLISLLWKRYNSLFLIATLVLSSGSNIILKAIFRRDRPELIRWLTTESGFSYPSGHSMASMAFYGAFLVLVKHSNIKTKWIIYISTGLLIFLIGVSRIYLGVHYPSDVIGGWAFGYLFVCIIDYIVGGIYEGTIKWSK